MTWYETSIGDRNIYNYNDRYINRNRYIYYDNINNREERETEREEFFWERDKSTFYREQNNRANWEKGEIIWWMKDKGEKKKKRMGERGKGEWEERER